MEGASNGGLLYHEVQESKLCAVHCVNTVLQGPFFSELDLAALASDLDCKERQMMLRGSASSAGDFLSEESHNVSLDGDFSIQVLQKALEVWDLQVIPLDSPVAEPAQIDPEMESAFICHLQDHWFCIRKVNGDWYNFDSLYAAPQHLSKFYLSAYLDSLKGFGWSIFLVRGNFPKEFPISSSESNGYGQWLSPEDAERITKSCTSIKASPQRIGGNQQNAGLLLSQEEAELLSDMEDEDLKAAIAASLMDHFPPVVSPEARPIQIDDKNSKEEASDAVILQDNKRKDREEVCPEGGSTQHNSAKATETETAEANLQNDVHPSKPMATASASASAGTLQDENKYAK